MPSLTADFALLSYVDLAFEIQSGGGDGMVDGLGSDTYFGIPVNSQYKVLKWLARGIRLPRMATELPWVSNNFELCFALGTLQMNAVERVFPGSRFTDARSGRVVRGARHRAQFARTPACRSSRRSGRRRARRNTA